MRYEHIHNRLLEGCRHVGHIDRDALHAACIQVVEDGGFHAAEAEVIAGSRHLSPGKCDRMGISLSGSLVDFGASGIAQADFPRHLVKSLSRRVVLCLSQNLIFTVIADKNQMRVSAGDYQAGKRRLQCRFRDIIRADMSLDMVHTDQRYSGREAQSLGGGDTDQQGTDQSGPIGDRDGIQILQSLSGLLQPLPDHLRDSLGMLSGGYFRHDTPVQSMDIDLGGNHVGKDLAPVDHDRGSCLIAAGFNCKYGNIFFYISHFFLL